jgi:hypothetical protein
MPPYAIILAGNHNFAAIPVVVRGAWNAPYLSESDSPRLINLAASVGDKFVLVRVLVIVIEFYPLAAIHNAKAGWRQIVPYTINRDGHPGSHIQDDAAGSITITRTNTSTKNIVPNRTTCSRPIAECRSARIAGWVFSNSN